MFFFSGTVFSLQQLSLPLRAIAEVLPLTHCIRLARAIIFSRWENFIFDISYVIIGILLFGFLGINRIKKRLID
jgi:lipooligosaccharide transport system permease protein